MTKRGSPPGRLSPRWAGSWPSTPVMPGWALLTWVPGHELTGQDDAEQDLIGRTLAKVHRALTGYQVPQAQRFHWVDPAAP